MESIENIRILLDRFYNGISTLEEEKLLKEYFESSSVPEDLLPDKDLFLSLDSDPGKIEIPEDLNRKIIARIDQAEQREVRSRRITLFSLSGLAAGLLILISVYLFFLKDNPEKYLAGNTIEDTYDDPMVAYEEVKRTLAFVSDKLNTGTSELKYVRKVNQSYENLKPLSFISKGNKELLLLNQLEKANQIKTQ